MKSTPKNLIEIQKALEAHDLGKIKLKSHAIKSSARSIGAFAMTETAGKMEQAAIDNDLDQAAKLYHEFKNDFESVVNFF